MRILFVFVSVALVGCRYELPTEVTKQAPEGPEIVTLAGPRAPLKERVAFSDLASWLTGSFEALYTAAQLEEFTFTIWTRPERTSPEYYYRLAEKGGYTVGKGFGLEYKTVEHGDVVQCLIWDSQGMDAVKVRSKASTAINDGEWHHVTCVYDGRKVSLYVDGRFQAQAQARYYDNEAPVTIGKQAMADDKYFPGDLAEVSLYNYALSEEEIDAGISQDPLGF